MTINLFCFLLIIISYDNKVGNTRESDENPPYYIPEAMYLLPPIVFKQFKQNLTHHYQQPHHHHNFCVLYNQYLNVLHHHIQPFANCF